MMTFVDDMTGDVYPVTETQEIITAPIWLGGRYNQLEAPIHLVGEDKHGVIKATVLGDFSVGTTDYSRVHYTWNGKAHLSGFRERGIVAIRTNTFHHEAIALCLLNWCHYGWTQQQGSDTWCIDCFSPTPTSADGTCAICGHTKEGLR